MENLKIIDNEIMEQEDNEKKYAFLNAQDTNNLLLTYLKGVKYVLLDYINGNFEDDPDVAYAMLEEFLDKAINNSIKIDKYLKLERENRKVARGLK